MNRLIFIRHGESFANTGKLFSYKKADYGLTPVGVLQAEQAAGALAGMGAEALYASPMLRAFETGKILAGRLHLPLTLLEEFREVDVGQYDGQPYTDAGWRAYHTVTTAWFNGDHKACLPGGGDYLAHWERLRRGLERIFAGQDGRRILLVGHAGIFIATLGEICPNLDVDWLRNAELFNGAICELDIEIRDEQPAGRLLSWNRHEHLSGAAAVFRPGIPPADSFAAPSAG